MAWDKDLPATDQKLRTLSGVLTSNFDAIQEADETTGTPLYQKALILPDRSDAGIATAADPTVVGASTYVYSKQDGGSIQELYMKDAASNEIQLSNGGKIGSTSTAYEMSNISFDGTITYDETMLPRAWGLIAAGGGSFLINKNFVSVSLVTSYYTVDITGMAPGGGDFTNVNDYAVIATSSGSANRTVQVRAKGLTSFGLQITDDKGATQTDVQVAVTMMMA